MSRVRLTGSTSGYVEITAPAIAGNNTVTLPSTNGSADQLLKNGATPGVLEYSTVSIGSTGELDNIASINGGPLAGLRNRIINGDMRIAQRGTSFAAILSGEYSLDRWAWAQQGAMVCTVSQDTDVPNDTFQSSYKVDVTTADTSIAASDVAGLLQFVEGYNARDLIGTTFTLSFWVKSPKTGVHCVSFRNGDPTPDRSYIKEYTVVAANTWEYKTLTVSGGLVTAGTWNWTDGRGLSVRFTLATGTDFQTTADAWQTGNFSGTSNQVNVMDSTANNFYITGVQLEPGSVATPFERRSFGQELALCQRYYCETRGSVRADAPGAGATYENQIYWPVTMRAAPTVAAPSSGATSNISSNTTTGLQVSGARHQIISTGSGDTYAINRLIQASAEL